MREILFRAKQINSNNWRYGDLMQSKVYNKYFYRIFEDDGEYRSNYAVNGDTVGQYTGIVTKNDLQKIFEYDIIDADGRKVGNYYENKYLLENGTNLLIEKMGTREWSRSEQEAIKRGCKYAE